MAAIPRNPEIIVIGAGAAGVAAGRVLAASGLSFVVIEARGRLGGRAWTHHAGTHAIDLGAGWMHSAESNPIAEEAARGGFEINREDPPWQKTAWDGNFPRDEQRAYRRAWSEFYERMEAAANLCQASGADRVGAELLEPGGAFNAMIDAGSTFVNGVELDRLSVIDFDRYRDSGINWRAPMGLGALISTFGANLPVVFDCAATRLDRSGARLKLETSKGEFSARAIIVTVSTNLLAAEALRFWPPLPEKIEAAAKLPLGVADKLFLSIDGHAQHLPVEARLYGRRDRTAMASYHLRPFGRPLIECYFGGRFARELEAGGPQAFAAYAIEDIAAALGSDVGKRLSLAACSSWARDPFALGSYSHALPGFSDLRATLAAPVEDRLFFAGEATSKHDFSTAHGAWRTGAASAAAALACVSSSKSR